MKKRKPDFDYSKLKGKIAELAVSQKELSEKIGISEVSLTKKLNNKTNFTQTEISNCLEILKIPKEEIFKYFFCKKS